jgi:hypothetical protein
MIQNDAAYEKMRHCNTNDKKMKQNDSREKIRTKMTQNDDEMMPKCPKNNTKRRKRSKILEF